MGGSEHTHAHDNKISVTERGGCTFTLKYEHCLEAGAVGALVVNTVDDFTTMPVSSVSDDFPYMFTTSSIGAALREIAAEAGGPSALSVSAGAGVGSSRALPGFSDGPALTAMALGSDSDVIALSGPNPFKFVEYASYDAGRDLLYLLCDNGNIHVIDIGDIVGGESGEYQVLGSFESMLGPSPLNSMYIFSHPGATNGSASPVLVGAAPDGSGPGFYNISDPLVPELVSQLTLDTSFCPEAFTGVEGGLATIVGDGGYAYALPFYSGSSTDLPDTCTGLEVDGVNYGNFPIAIYDIEDLGTPSLGTINQPDAARERFVRRVCACYHGRVLLSMCECVFAYMFLSHCVSHVCVSQTNSSWTLRG